MTDGPTPAELGSSSEGSNEPPKVPKFINELGKTARFQADINGKSDGQWRFAVRDTHSADGSYPKGRFLGDPKTEKTISYDSLDAALAFAAEKNGPGTQLEEPKFEEGK